MPEESSELLAGMASVVPNFEGEEATAFGLPPRDQLSKRDRTIVDLSAGADIALRTGAATLVSTAVIPTVLNRSFGERERENLGFYAELAAAHDPSRSFPRPTSMPTVHRKRANPLARAMVKGTVEALTFDSPFEPVNPALRPLWESRSRNRVAHAQHWRHEDGPRPTLCVIHGFMASPYWLNGLFLQLPWFYKAGFDVLLYTLPFHGARASRLSPFSGHGYFSQGTTGFSEAMAHAVHDFRIFVDYLESTGVEKVGVTGISLGGYTTALLASVEDRLQVAIPNVPVVDVQELVSKWFPASALIDVGLRLGGIDRGLMGQALAYSSALNYQPLVAKERRLIITGLGDRLAPPEQSEMLWRHWERCSMYWFPGNHVLHVSQPDYLRRMTHFLRDNDFVPDEWRSRTEGADEGRAHG